MAEVDFGATELIQQLNDFTQPAAMHDRFTDDEEDQDDTSQLGSRLEDCDGYIQRLTEENKDLRRRLKILTQPSGIIFEDVNIDGPLLQVLYTNIISKQCRQEIEDSICSVILKHQKDGHEKKQSCFHMKPQHSALADEDLQRSISSSVKTTTEAFKVVGSVLYFTTFRVDKLGQHLVKGNPQLTDGWDIPNYHQVFNHVIGADGLERERKEKRPRSMCFNCGSSTHKLRGCPKTKETSAITKRRKEFSQNNNQTLHSNRRYHADEVKEQFARYKPGGMSEHLLTALEIDGNTLPPLIYQMRELGHPPGCLKKAEIENSGLTLYDGNASNDGNTTEDSNLQTISFDVAEMVDCPGFNVLAPDKMKDELMQDDSIPMQNNLMKKSNAAYLTDNFPMLGSTCNKRRHESGSSPQLKKKKRSGPDCNSDRISDIDIETGNCLFWAPFFPIRHIMHLRCNTNSTPPLLPKGRPPSSPTNGSPVLQEKPKKQQRLIWAALENADTTTNSDCETPVMGTPVPSSASISTRVYADTETEEVEESVGPMRPAETSHSNENKNSLEEICSRSPGPHKVEMESPQSPEPVKAQDNSAQDPGQIKSHNDSTKNPNPIKSQEDNLQSPDFSNEGAKDWASHRDVKMIKAVPHRSRFAAGILPFEETPEFTEVAESTGTYLRIRDILKGSPRSLAKKK
ncbi:zinc finger CCHC domain-containing protein 8-like [Channa argus]|uniref:zinc finger CCHC domain-containing protein 8-like n=1 Tax=Channa argus TaxID=215402 RepID=UPI00352116E0